MKVLGGRSPYEVVLGLKPTFPSALIGSKPIQELSPDEYVRGLVEYFRSTDKGLRARFQEATDAIEGRGKGTENAGLQKGDAVLLRRETATKREGPRRFQERTYDATFRVKSGQSPNFHIGYWHDPAKDPPTKNPVREDRLIRLDMPELTLVEGQPTVLEILPVDADPEAGWVRYQVDKFSRYGMVQLTKVGDPGVRDGLICPG